MNRHLVAMAMLLVSIIGLGQSIKDLDFLIGTWQIEETVLPSRENEYQETGTRTCSYYLNDAFIKCESTTTNSRNERERKYVYFINYDKKLDCFWATTLASDFPKHGLHQWFLDEENQQIIAITPENVNKDRFFRGAIYYGNKDQLIWDGWSSKFTSPDKEWQQIFHDVATKKE